MSQSLAISAISVQRFGVLRTVQRESGPESKTNDVVKTGNPMIPAEAKRSDSLTDIESRLINWGRWCNGTKSSSGGHCGSIEWQWVDKWKQKYGWADPPDTNKILAKVDVLDAELIQSTMIHLPITYRQVLSMRYVKKESAKRTAYKVGCKEWALDAVISDAKHALKIYLTGLKKHG